jgi:uncharacterized protein YbjT (DUF2867 family)
LLEKKQPVRVIVRDAKKGEPWKALGAEVAVADAQDAAALERAFKGANGVYALIPPDLKSKDPIGRGQRIADALVTALKDAKAQHVVLLSSVGAQHASGTGPIKMLHYAENKLRAAGLNATFLRAAYFMENALGMIEPVKSQGVLPVFADPSYPFAMVATRDIGLTAAKALLEGGKGISIIELAGAREQSMNDVANAFSTALGKPVKAVLAPLDQLIPSLEKAGISPQIGAEFKEMYEGMAAGKLAWEGGAARAVRGTIDVDAFAKAALSPR